MDRETQRRQRATVLRDRFAARAKTRQGHLDSAAPDTTAAEQEAKELDKIVGVASHEGLAVDVLKPLTAASQPAHTRCESADYLLYTGKPEEAKPVLEALAQRKDIGKVADRAAAAIRTFRPGKSSRLEK